MNPRKEDYEGGFGTLRERIYAVAPPSQAQRTAVLDDHTCWSGQCGLPKIELRDRIVSANQFRGIRADLVEPKELTAEDRFVSLRLDLDRLSDRGEGWTGT